jgi:hypothetical protein
MVGLWAWGALDGDLSVPLASDRFRAWSKLAIGLLLVAAGIAYTIAIRREQRRRPNGHTVQSRSQAVEGRPANDDMLPR